MSGFVFFRSSRLKAQAFIQAVPKTLGLYHIHPITKGTTAAISNTIK